MKVESLVGTMIEVPRGAMTADEIAKEAEFFSFGTNDLTQMGFGLSRDDAGKFLVQYIEDGILDRIPCVHRRVGWSASSSRSACARAAKRSRGSRSRLREHGGDPASIRFFTRPPRLRVVLAVSRAHRAPAAAQAELEKPSGMIRC